MHAKAENIGQIRSLQDQVNNKVNNHDYHEKNVIVIHETIKISIQIIALNTVNTDFKTSIESKEVCVTILLLITFVDVYAVQR